MIAAFDVHYLEAGGASAAAVLFSSYGDAEPAAEYRRWIPSVAEYVPGSFYQRELPCLLALLDNIREPIHEILVDGFVNMGRRRGLGYHLFNALNGRTPVIGVAKSRFKGSSGVEVFRGGSQQPLYVTSAGIDLQIASEKIKRMHGNYRIPTLLKRVDILARERSG
jgi:deoxyribonuclease V